jgi:circadian clock protein KaiB
VTPTKGSGRATGAARSRAAASSALPIEGERYELHLFIAGTTPRSAVALMAVSAICEERLRGRYDLIVIDVYQQPARARDEDIIAVPTLLKLSPSPVRRLIGDLSDRARVLAGLGLPLERSTSHGDEQ